LAGFPKEQERLLCQKHNSLFLSYYIPAIRVFAPSLYTTRNLPISWFQARACPDGSLDTAVPAFH